MAAKKRARDRHRWQQCNALLQLIFHIPVFPKSPERGTFEFAFRVTLRGKPMSNFDLTVPEWDALMMFHQEALEKAAVDQDEGRREEAEQYHNERLLRLIEFANSNTARRKRN